MPQKRDTVDQIVADLLKPCGTRQGQDTFQCCECGGEFDVDWGEGVVRYEPRA